MRWIDREQDLPAVCDALRKAKTIAVDTEFIRESTFFPQLEILQIGTADQVWILDAQALPREGAAMDELKSILTDPSILKCMHAALGDQECLVSHYGYFAKPIFDTAVGASLLGYGENMGLAALLKLERGIHLPKGLSRTNWSKRPLSDSLLEYAALDVEHLVALADQMLDKLRERGRERWALHLSESISEKSKMENEADAMAERMARGGRLDPKNFGVLRELVRWRERRIREMNIPRRWLADDRILMDLTKVQPKSMDQLLAFRGLHQGEIRKNGQALLKLIADGKALGAAGYEPRRGERPVSEDTRAVQLMRCYMGVLSDRTGISAKYLVPTELWPKAIRAARQGDIQTPEDLVRLNFVGPEAVEMVGKDLVAFLCGKVALRISYEGGNEDVALDSNPS